LSYGQPLAEKDRKIKKYLEENHIKTVTGKIYGAHPLLTEYYPMKNMLAMCFFKKLM